MLSFWYFQVAPHTKRVSIDAMWNRICNEPMDSKSSGSIKKLNVHPDEGVELLITRAPSQQVVPTHP